MPTQERWIDAQILSTVWTAPLTNSEVVVCFTELKEALRSVETVVHILFDIQKAGSIPVQAPVHFVRSQLAIQANLGSIAVNGTNPIAQVLAQTAINMTGQNMLFFCDATQAIEYLRSNLSQDKYDDPSTRFSLNKTDVI